MKTMIDFDAAPVFGIPLLDRSAVREGMLIEGPQGWGEFSPPPESDDRETTRWLTSAIEGGTVGWPDARRGRIPIAVAVPAVEPAAARLLVEGSGCLSADVTVAAHANSLAEDVVRVEVVRDALGPQGRIRLNAKGMWNVDDAVTAISVLANAAGDVEFVELPSATIDEMAAVRRQVDVRIAADVSSAEVSDVEVDVAILRSGPLGGVRRALRVAERLGLPCVVASSYETSIGLASGLALAGSLPELPFACALGTISAFVGDVVVQRRSLHPVDGYLPVAPTPASPAQELLDRYALTDVDRIEGWRRRLRLAQQIAT